jgi:hypothetical protein
MVSGIIILSIVALLFLGMYLYSYRSTKENTINEESAKHNKLKVIQEKEEQLYKERQERMHLRDENSRLGETRSEIIKKEIARLQEQKQKHKARN